MADRKLPGFHFPPPVGGKPGEISQAAAFVSANNPLDYIQGPLGSGKTKAMCIRAMRHAQEQAKSPIDGLRYTRWAMVRNTTPLLKISTIETWLETFREEVYGKFNWAPPIHHDIAFGDVRAKFYFYALDKMDDIKKLRSTEFTGICFNELPFIEKPIFDEADSRLRYPPTEHCPPDKYGRRDPTWRGILADGNAPDEDSWVAAITGQIDPPSGISEEERKQYDWPREWGKYMQPAALIEVLDQRGMLTGYKVNPQAENLQNLPSDYYERQLRGKTRAWIDSRLMNRVALVVDGSPVWPMFRREFHVSKEPLEPVPGHDVMVWLDFGRVYPAALFAQEVNQRINVQHEILGFNEPASVFAPRVKRFLEKTYPGSAFRCVGDPKGRDKGQQTEQSSYDIFAGFGMTVTPAPVKMNNIEERTEAVAYALNDNPSGVPSLVFSSRCRTLIVGMAGRYCLVKEEDGEFRPKKDKYSNLCDALQYGCVGLGLGRRMKNLKPLSELRGVSVYKGHRSRRRVSA